MFLKMGVWVEIYIEQRQFGGLKKDEWTIIMFQMATGKYDVPSNWESENTIIQHVENQHKYGLYNYAKIQAIEVNIRRLKILV